MRFMSAKLILRNKEYEVPAGTSILYALVKLGIEIQAVRPLRDGELITLQETIQDGDVIQLVPFVSGG
jgi:sulfur carrier protein ThiS